MSKEIALTIHKEQLIESLRLAFADSHSFIQELAQNGRRAGANSIVINYDDKNGNIIISDDGCGIYDLSSLFSVAVSNWDSEVADKENPYGVGFLSVLYQCKEIKVTSLGQTFTAKTDDILAFKPIKVMKAGEDSWTHVTPLNTIKVAKADNDGWTHVELRAVNLDFNFDFDEVADLFKGFPVNVFLNGKALYRPFAIGAEDTKTVELDSGTLILQNNTRVLDENWRKGLELYYQGFRVHLDYGNFKDQQRVVVHVDETKYDAVLPDRRGLVNSNICISTIGKEVASFQRNEAREFFNEKYRADAYCDSYDSSYYRMVSDLNELSLYNKLDFLPGLCVERCDESYPIDIRNHIAYHYDRCNYGRVLEKDILSGKLRVVHCSLPLELETGFTLEMYLYSFGNVVAINSDQPNTLVSNLSEEHWLKANATKIDREQIQTKISNPVPCSSQLNNTDIVFFDELIMDGPLGEISVTEPCYLPSPESDGCIIYVPSKAEAHDFGDVIKQAFDVSDDGCKDLRYLDSLEEEITRLFLAHKLSDNPPELLKQCLRHVPEQLHGRSLNITFSDEGIPEVSLA